MFPRNTEFKTLKDLLPPGLTSLKAQGIGDDGYLVYDRGDKGLAHVFTTDVSFEGRHFNLKWTSLEEEFEKAVLSNISDVAAMGGVPTRLFLNLGMGRSWTSTTTQKLKRKIAGMQKKFGFKLCGGDLIKTQGPSFFSIFFEGNITGRALLRSNAKPGHKIYLSGPTGLSAAGLDHLRNRAAYVKNTPKAALKKLIGRHHKPVVPWKLGPLLANFKTQISGIDTSDGLSSELHHLALQSKAKMVVQWEKLRIFKYSSHFPPHRIKNWILNGGEDYQLLFTGDFTAKQLNQIQKQQKIFEIGRVERGKGVYLEESGGNVTPLNPKGWSH